MTTLIQLLEEIKAEIVLTRQSTGVKELSSDIAAAMASVPRTEFVPEEYKRFAYENRPLPIGHNQTISQPYIVALMTALLEPTAQDHILEIGTGCGYQAAVLSRLVQQVYSVERVYPLFHSARERIKRLGYTNIELLHADGGEGWPQHAPYDGILVTAAGLSIPPALVHQLKPGRHLIMPLGSRFGQELVKVTKTEDNGGYVSEKVLDVAFVPLLTGCEE